MVCSTSENRMTASVPMPTARLFPAHVFSERERLDALLNNIVIDWQFGHGELLRKQRWHQPEAHALVDRLSSASEADVATWAEKARSQSLLMTALFLSGGCDADCEICYTARQSSKRDLSWAEIQNVVDQVIALGNRTIYIPGEGEPFKDKKIFDLIDYCAARAQNVVIFTNGILLSDDQSFRKTCGFPLAEFLQIVRTKPVFLYVKYWHSDKNRFANMMRIAPELLNTRKRRLANGSVIDVPQVIDDLLEVAPDRVGIETAVHSLNFDDILSHMTRLVQETGLKWYLEPILHAGRYFQRHDYDLTPEQWRTIGPYLSKQQCKRTGFSTTILGKGHLSYCPSFVTNHSFMSIPSILDGLNIRVSEEKGKIKDLFTLLHTNEFLVRARYAAYSCECLCERVASRLEAGLSWEGSQTFANA
jgi:organic radical activating enzyme